jgi:hypothetical protein
LTVQQREAQNEAFSINDYGSVGDQRPYQIVRPAYPAPQFMNKFMYLNQALRECQTLCEDQGRPFRLVKWGKRIPCSGCNRARTAPGGKLPSFTVRALNGLSGLGCGCASKSGPALQGFPDAQVVADVKPSGQTIIYGPGGAPQLVGAPNYVITTDPMGVEIDPKKQLPKRYLEAVQSAQILAERVGKRVYICSAMGCKGMKGAIPVVYVNPGGIARANPLERGNANVINKVSPEHFQQLIAESRGASYLPADA